MVGYNNLYCFSSIFSSFNLDKIEISFRLYFGVGSVLGLQKFFFIKLQHFVNLFFIILFIKDHCRSPFVGTHYHDGVFLFQRFYGGSFLLADIWFGGFAFLRIPAASALRDGVSSTGTKLHAFSVATMKSSTGIWSQLTAKLRPFCNNFSSGLDNLYLERLVTHFFNWLLERSTLSYLFRGEDWLLLFTVSRSSFRIWRVLHLSFSDWQLLLIWKSTRDFTSGFSSVSRSLSITWRFDSRLPILLLTTLIRSRKSSFSALLMMDWALFVRIGHFSSRLTGVTSKSLQRCVNVRWFCV